MSASVRWCLWATFGAALALLGFALAAFLGSPVLGYGVGALLGVGVTVFSYEMQGSRWYP